MSDKPTTLVSIIIPTYNRAYCLWKAILSVQAQSYPYWELLIVDDGSTDDTKKLVAEFQSDPRIIYIAKVNGGVCSARNEGLEAAKGEIITYLDSDDVFYSECLSVALDFFRKFPEKIFAIPNCNRRLELYDENFRLVDFTESSSSQKSEVTLQDIYHWNVKSAYGTGLFHKSIVREAGITWDESVKLFNDWDFVLQLADKYPKGFIHIPYVLYKYLQKYGTDGTCSNASYGKWAEGFETIYKKHKDEDLMQGQKWFPERVERYRAMQEKVERGEIPSSVYKYFPEHFKK